MDSLERLRRLRDPTVRRRIRDGAAVELIGTTPSLLVVTGLTACMVVIGIDYYGGTFAGVPVVLWPLYADSAVAAALATLTLLTVLPTIASGGAIEDVPTNRPLAYLQTVTFVWLVQFGLWPLVSLNLAFEAYASAPDAWIYYWGVIGTHLAFVGLASLIPAFGRTTPGALAVALCASVGNVFVDYGLGYHPPLLYEPGMLLATATVGLGVFAVWWAHRSFRRLEYPDTDTGAGG